MDPLSITASLVGIIVPALHGVRTLLEDIQDLLDAPAQVKLLRDWLISTGHALDSLRNVSDTQWESLGEEIVNQARSAIQLCTESCDKLRAAFEEWTRHSSDGKLSRRDRVEIGFFRQSQMKSMSDQLQFCNITLASVASTATLHSSLGQTNTTEQMRLLITKQQTDLQDAIDLTGRQSAEYNTQLITLIQAKLDQDQTETDRTSALAQIAAEKSTQNISQKLLQELLSTVHAAAKDVGGQEHSVVTFGDNYQGSQVGNNYGTNHGGTYNYGK